MMIVAKSKQGHSQSQINQLTLDEVQETLGQATGLTPKEISTICHMRQEGYSPAQISRECGVELEVLKQFLLQGTTPVIRETVLGFETQEETQFDQGKRAPELGRINERAVLAHSLEGEGKTYYSDASERIPIHFTRRSPPTMTEETKESYKPQPTKTLSEPQHIPTFCYFCEERTNKLHMVNLLTGEQSCLEVPNYQFKWSCRLE
jgi:hypothetical protein